MPAYTAQTPLATQQINQTQAPIQTNFSSIQALVDVNHVDFSDPISFGKHLVTDLVQLVNGPLGLVPPFITGLPAYEFNIYNTVPNGNAVLTGVPLQGYPVNLTSSELIIERAPVAPQTLNTFIPITATNQFNDGTGQHGWAFLPSGILLKWGYVYYNPAGNSNTYFTFTYPVNGASPNGTIPAFNNVWSVNITSTSNRNGAQTGDPQVLTMLGDFTNTTINLFPRSLIGNQGQNDWTYFAIGTAQTN
jgi:hypothetical protein